MTHTRPCVVVVVIVGQGPKKAICFNGFFSLLDSVGFCFCTTFVPKRQNKKGDLGYPNEISEREKREREGGATPSCQTGRVKREQTTTTKRGGGRGEEWYR